MGIQLLQHVTFEYFFVYIGSIVFNRDDLVENVVSNLLGFGIVDVLMHFIHVFIDLFLFAWMPNVVFGV